MTTNDTVSDARGQEQATLTKGQLQRIEERDRIERRLREARRARWTLRRKRPSSPSDAVGQAGKSKEQDNGQAGKSKEQEETPLTPAQRQRLEERRRVEHVVRNARRARWTLKKGRPHTAEQRAAVAKAKAETRLGRSTRALVACALGISVALIGFSIHALVERNALNRDLAGLIEETERLASEQASALESLEGRVGGVAAATEKLAAATEKMGEGLQLVGQLEAATAAGIADVSAGLGKIDALTEAVNALAMREADRARDATPTPPSAFTERAVTLPSGRDALLSVPAEAQRAVLLIPGAAAADPLRQVAEYLAARGCVVLRINPVEATAEENLSAALAALDALLAQPEAVGRGVTVMAYGESAGVAASVAEARPEVVNLVLLASTTQPAEGAPRMRQAVQIVGPIDEAALGTLESWITAQGSPPQ